MSGPRRDETDRAVHMPPFGVVRPRSPRVETTIHGEWAAKLHRWKANALARAVLVILLKTASRGDSARGFESHVLR